MITEYIKAIVTADHNGMLMPSYQGSEIAERMKRTGLVDKTGGRLTRDGLTAKRVFLEDINARQGRACDFDSGVGADGLGYSDFV